MSTNTKLLELLRTTKITDLPSIKSQQLVQFDKDLALKDVYNELTSKSILSAPIFDSEKGEYVGLVDLRDFVGFILSLHLKGGPIIFDVGKIVDFSGMNQFITVDSQSSILDLLETFIKTGVHRAAVIENNNPKKVLYIVSQSAVVDWLSQHLSAFQTEANKSVGELQKELGGVSGMTQLLLHIKEDEPVLNAFKLMDQFNVHGIPVLDKEGRIVANISVSDMKYIVQYDLECLNAPFTEFFKATHSSRTPVICTKSNTFGEVISTLTKEKVHRVYVTEDKKPIDIITLTNVLDTIYTIATGNKIM